MSKFNSKRDEVVYNKTLDGWSDDEIGSVADLGWHASFIDDLYGTSYVVVEDTQGFVEVDAYKRIVHYGQDGPMIGTLAQSAYRQRCEELQTEADSYYAEAEAEEEAERQVAAARDQGRSMFEVVGMMAYDPESDTLA